MSAPPSSSIGNTSSPNPSTKRITIKTDSDKDNRNPEVKNKAIKTAFRIALTLFYGQFVANGIYDNLIRTIPYLVDKSPSVTHFTHVLKFIQNDNLNFYKKVYTIIKVTIGILIIGLTVFAMIAIWMNQRILIFASAILLIALSIASLIISKSELKLI
jgi:hypothetical protein